MKKTNVLFLCTNSRGRFCADRQRAMVWVFELMVNYLLSQGSLVPLHQLSLLPCSGLRNLIYCHTARTG